MITQSLRYRSIIASAAPHPPIHGFGPGSRRRGTVPPIPQAVRWSIRQRWGEQNQNSPEIVWQLDGIKGLRSPAGFPFLFQFSHTGNVFHLPFLLDFLNLRPQFLFQLFGHYVSPVKRLFVVLFLTLTIPVLAWSEQAVWQGKVVGVSDGDGVTVMHHGRSVIDPGSSEKHLFI